MKPRCLLSTVDILPTISEMQESDLEDGDPECPTHSMQEYLDSIRELSQPAPYPRHGPLRGHRRWMTRPSPRANGGCSIVTPVAPSSYIHSSSTYAPWTPIGLSDVSLTVIHQSDCETSQHFNHNLLDRLVAQSLFAGLV
ncbi:uncharacterized protein LOC144538522 [Centroberyx gerrardi]